jgi:hypothetical protein
VKGDNLSLSFPTTASLAVLPVLLGTLKPEQVRPIPNVEAMENLKFSECLSPEIATEVLFFQDYIQKEGQLDALSELNEVKLTDSQLNIKRNCLLFLERLNVRPIPATCRKAAQFDIEQCYLGRRLRRPISKSAHRISHRPE